VCLLATTSLAAAVSMAAPAVAQTPAASEAPAPTARRAIDGTTLGGFVLPTKPIAGGCTLSATRVWKWKNDDTQRLYLEGDVRASLGGYSFSAKRATVWINRLPVGSETATQIAIWFERADEPTRRAGLGASGRDLLVTSSYLGETKLSAVVTESGVASDRAFIAAGETRLARHLRTLTRDIAAGTQPLGTQPVVDVRTPVEEAPPQPGGSLLEAAIAQPTLPDAIAMSAPAATPLPIFRPEGTVSFSADSIVIDEKLDRIAIQGMVELEYLSTGGGAERSLQLSAERGVIFLVPGGLSQLRTGTRSLDASVIAGIYLEGAVQASDGDYSVRGAQVYYDLAENRAVMVDAVLRTYDRRRKDLPIYTRAAELKQVAADQWTADTATVSTSEFFTPHLSIGVDRVTVTQQPADPTLGTPGGVYVSAEGAGIEIGGKRFIPLPGYEGRVDRIPVRSIEAGYEEYRGVEIGTEWDLFALAGAAPIAGLDAELAVDAFTDRGAAIGTTFTLTDSLGSGIIDLYGLYDAGGTDQTSAGGLVEVDSGVRGIVDAEWQTALSSAFNLQTQFSYISDETFVSAWRQEDFDNRREFETSVYLNGISDNTAFSTLLKYDLNDFISNSYLLASRGYVVDKLPEISYRRYGDNMFDGVTWTQQWSANMMSLRPTTGTPNSLGVPGGAWGGAIGAAQSVEDAYLAAGYDDNLVSRLDTRHEISVPLSSDWITVTPFATGEATGYLLDELTQYTADVDTLRFQAGGGVRGSMRFVRVDDTVQSRLLDLNRMRHIIEPYSTAWAGWDSNDEGALPIYDQDYEGTTGGAAVNLGVRNTFQTQRGGSGAWQSVDWIKVDLGLVVNDSASDFTPQPVNPPDPNSSLRWTQSPMPAFYTFRPELSQWGSHGYGAMVWQLSDSLTMGGTMNYLFDDQVFVTDADSVLPNLARGSLGIEMRHNPVASTYVEYRYLAPTNSELLQAGFLYRAGKRYLLAFSPQYDLQAGEFRAVSGSVTRTFPDFDLNANAGYDLIEDNTFVGLSLSIPAGSRASRQNFGAYTPSMSGTR
jgi:hypothetical protein